jgi:3-carboxy-cis,cis-muconate cycloisomerase
MTDDDQLDDRLDDGLGGYASLFAPVFGSAAVERALSPHAWVQAMLDVEAALVGALADVGAIPAEHAATVAEHARVAELGADGVRGIAVGSPAAGNPVPPLVRALTAVVPGAAAKSIHRGATSQDITDTATMLLVRRALAPVLADLDALADAVAALAERHRHTVIAGRTLSQQAVPTTFGAKAAGWLHSTLAATARLRELLDRLPAQLGGAAGTLASLHDRGVDGPAVVAAFARRLELAEPVLPWHTLRAPVAEVASTVGVAAGVLGKIAQDVVLLAQTEVGEVSEPAGGGGSSTMPHKQNPIRSITALAAVRRAPGLVSTVLAAMVAEHERPASAWHSEWEPVRDLLRILGGAAERLRVTVAGLRVHPERMRANLDITGGLLLAENVTAALAPALGRLAAHDLVTAACQRAVAQDRPLREVLVAHEQVLAHLTAAEVDAALDPARYRGAGERFLDRALTEHRTHRAQGERR